MRIHIHLHQTGKRVRSFDVHPAAPVGHTLHSHNDPAEYEGWIKQGKSTHQLGKKLAMKKFLSKKTGATA